MHIHHLFAQGHLDIIVRIPVLVSRIVLAECRRLVFRLQCRRELFGIGIGRVCQIRIHRVLVHGRPQRIHRLLHSILILQKPAIVARGHCDLLAVVVGKRAVLVRRLVFQAQLLDPVPQLVTVVGDRPIRVLTHRKNILRCHRLRIAHLQIPRQKPRGIVPERRKLLLYLGICLQ